MRYILAIDQSTSATKAAILSEEGEQVCSASLRHRQIYPKPGWVEHDAQEIYQNVLQTCGQVLEHFEAQGGGELAAMGISNQRETVVLWDQAGRPVGNAVVWQDSRAQSVTDAFTKEQADLVRSRTGLKLSPLFGGAKIAYLLQGDKALREMADAGKLMGGTVDAYLCYRLTGEFKTDYSNASRTQLMNLEALAWDEDCLKLFGIPEEMLPRPVPSDSVFGYTTLEGRLKAPIPVCGVLGDSHAAMFAQGCHGVGDTKATYGTGSSIMQNTGGELKWVEGISTTMAYACGGKVYYALEGNISHAADTVSFLLDLGVLKNAADSEEMAKALSGNDGVYLVPAFTGLGPPWWDAHARALICGISRDTGAGHLARAALEAIAYQVEDILGCMAQAGLRPTQLKTDGGPTANGFLMQFQADVSQVPVDVADGSNLSLRGAALLAALGAGVLKDEAEAAALRHSAGRYAPKADAESAAKWMEGWHGAVQRATLRPGQ